MVDIELFDKSLKLTWLRRFMTGEPKWKQIITSLYPDTLNLWKYGNNYIMKLSMAIENPFWTNVFSYYYEIHKKVEICSYEELGETSFLYNDRIRIGNKVIVNNDLARNGIFLIKHLWEDTTFLSHEEFVLKFNVSKVTQNCPIFSKAFDLLVTAIDFRTILSPKMLVI